MPEMINKKIKGSLKKETKEINIKKYMWKKK